MSLRKHYHMNILDASLGRILKNWVAGRNPPAGGRARLLQTAALASTPKASILFSIVSFFLGGDFIEPHSNDRFLIATTSSFRPGLLGLL